MTDMTERAFYNELDATGNWPRPEVVDTAADWRPIVPDGNAWLRDVDRAWTMAAHLSKLHRYDLAVYLGWGTAYGRGLCTETELRGYLRRYRQADALGISWRRIAWTVWGLS